MLWPKVQILLSFIFAVLVIIFLSISLVTPWYYVKEQVYFTNNGFPAVRVDVNSSTRIFSLSSSSYSVWREDVLVIDRDMSLPPIRAFQDISHITKIMLILALSCAATMTLFLVMIFFDNSRSFLSASLIPQRLIVFIKVPFLVTGSLALSGVLLSIIIYFGIENAFRDETPGCLRGPCSTFFGAEEFLMEGQVTINQSLTSGTFLVRHRWGPAVGWGLSLFALFLSLFSLALGGRGMMMLLFGGGRGGMGVVLNNRGYTEWHEAGGGVGVTPQGGLIALGQPVRAPHHHQLV